MIEAYPQFSCLYQYFHADKAYCMHSMDKRETRINCKYVGKKVTIDIFLYETKEQVNECNLKRK